MLSLNCIIVQLVQMFAFIQNSLPILDIAVFRFSLFKRTVINLCFAEIVIIAICLTSCNFWDGCWSSMNLMYNSIVPT